VWLCPQPFCRGPLAKSFPFGTKPRHEKDVWKDSRKAPFTDSTFSEELHLALSLGIESRQVVRSCPLYRYANDG